MVFVYNDFSRACTHINSIPVESLDSVKEWLDSLEIVYYDGPLNLNWPTIMRTVQQDPRAFFQDGGWSFLDNDSDQDSADASEEESEFEDSGSSDFSDGEDSDDSEFGNDDASASEDAGSDDDDSSAGES